MTQTEPNFVQPNEKPLTEEQITNIAKITAKFNDLGMEARFKKPISEGPIISCYRFLPIGRTKVSHLEGIAEDLAITLGAEDIVAKRMPGESAVGIFIPNAERKFIKFRDTIKHIFDYDADAEKKGLEKFNLIPLNFGIDYLGRPYIEDLAALPHLLIAGATGSGKSTFLTSLITSLVYCRSSSEVELYLSDTKGVEFRDFEGVDHLKAKPNTIYQTLEEMEHLIDMMETRLHKIGKGGCKNIQEYNLQHIAGVLPPSKGFEHMPFIIFIIDELADLMMYKGEKRGESSISTDKLSSLVQKGRAAGIHVIAATQRPSVNIVAGSIKANFPARLSFRLPTDFDSRTVLGTKGAEHLLARGDCFYVSPNRPGLLRLHAPITERADIRGALEAIRN